MAISLKTRKLIWSFSGGKCAKCKGTVVEEAISANGASVIAEEAHIVSPKPGGPRYDDAFPTEKLNLPENLLILCCNCHKVVDDQVGEYPAVVLREMKEKHETAVKESFGENELEKQRDDLLYADIVDQWVHLVDLDNWDSWSSSFFSPEPAISVDQDEQLANLPAWLLGRVWPGRYSSLEHAFHNFRCVLQDFHTTFHKHIDRCDDCWLQMERFYRTAGWLREDVYRRKVDEYEFHQDLVADLMFELTRAANYICDSVRLVISPVFRLKEGRVVLTLGGRCDVRLPEYRAHKESSQPYPGLEAFLKVRESRDFRAGWGEHAEDYRNRGNRNILAKCRKAGIRLWRILFYAGFPPSRE